MPVMITPRMGQGPNPGYPWATDTGRYASPDDYSDTAYLAWLGRWRPEVARCLFATAPDVVGDAAATLELSYPMLRPIRRVGYPVALVAQDGLEHLPVPWDQVDALFIGGTTAWKLGEAAFALGREALARGKHLHMGRVNSRIRLRMARAMGCHSVDGTYLAFGPRVNRPRLEGWLRTLDVQPDLPWGQS